MSNDTAYNYTADDIVSAMYAEDDASVDLVRKAYAFSKKAHEGQDRYSGAPFFSHPAEVAYYIAERGLDTESVATGLLHDIVEDTHVSQQEVQDTFGEEITDLVEGVTKLGSVRYYGEESHVKNLRKLFTATAQDIRVVLVKLMDRLHNARTFEFLPEDKNERIALETIEIYAAVADRLGMREVARELEDLAFPYAYPKKEKKVQEKKKQWLNRKEHLKHIQDTLLGALSENDLESAQVLFHEKGNYRLFEKLKDRDWNIDRIPDVVTLRVIVPNTSACYRVLGLVHHRWHPLPGEVKDYIANPKENGYQSIHTTIHPGDGVPFTIQIYTDKMHHEARHGIISLLTYGSVYDDQSSRTEGIRDWVRSWVDRVMSQTSFEKTPEDFKNEPIPDWISQLADFETEESDEYMQVLRSDFLNNRIKVFTTDGDVVDLPLGATPIDAAYVVDAELGNNLRRVRVGGEDKPLDTHLDDGDVVEFITDEKQEPSRDWLDVVKTSVARERIQKAMKRPA